MTWAPTRFSMKSWGFLPAAALLALVPVEIFSQAHTAVHPAYTISSLRPSGFNPSVSGLDFLPDGKLAVATMNNFGTEIGKVFILSGVQTGQASQVTMTTFAEGLNEPLGLKVVDGQIYVVERSQVTRLTDTNNDGKADQEAKVGPAWKYRPNQVGGEGRNLEFAMGLAYKNETFYVGLATAWPLNLAQDPERGCVIGIKATAASIDTLVCGMRTPNGGNLGPEDEVFFTENQGNWVPASKLVHIKKGRFYGVHKPTSAGVGPFDRVPETPPVAWMPHGEASVSPTQPVMLKSGPFAGQMIAGDNGNGTLQRFFIEKVKGEYQAAVFRFSGGLEAGVNRIVVGPDSAIYLGGMGFPSNLWFGWAWNSRYSGLQRMALNNTNPFDWVAVRSLASDKLELEFTQPVGASAESNSAYVVRQWGFTPAASYGAGVGTPTVMPVKSVTLSADRKRVTLGVDGLTLRNVVNIRLNNTVTAQNGGAASWSKEAWYTLNQHGPADPIVTALQGSAGRASVDGRQAPRMGHRVDMRGRLQLETHAGLPMGLRGVKTLPNGRIAP